MPRIDCNNYIGVVIKVVKSLKKLFFSIYANVAKIDHAEFRIKQNSTAKFYCVARCISLSLCRGGSILSVGGRPLSATSTRAVDTPGAIYLLLRTDAAAAASERARAFVRSRPPTLVPARACRRGPRTRSIYAASSVYRHPST